MSTRPTITPMLSYRDAPAAIDFLVRAFGFEELYRLTMPGGAIGHAELAVGDGRLSLASTWDEMGLAPPSELPAVHCQLQVEVPDVDAHHARAVAEGAAVVAAPEDQFYGARMYRAVDPEGHRWIFTTTLREVPVDELQAMMDGTDA